MVGSHGDPPSGGKDTRHALAVAFPSTPPWPLRFPQPRPVYGMEHALGISTIGWLGQMEGERRGAATVSCSAADLGSCGARWREGCSSGALTRVPVEQRSSRCLCCRTSMRTTMNSTQHLSGGRPMTIHRHRVQASEEEDDSHYFPQETQEQSNTLVSANDMCALDEWPSHARRNHEQLQNETNGQKKKKGRGVLKDLKASKKRYTNGSEKLNIAFCEHLGGTVRNRLAKKIAIQACKILF